MIRLFKRGIRGVCQRILELAQEKPKPEHAKLSRQQLTDRLINMEHMGREHISQSKLVVERVGEQLSRLDREIQYLRQDLLEVHRRINNGSSVSSTSSISPYSLGEPATVSPRIGMGVGHATVRDAGASISPTPISSGMSERSIPETPIRELSTT